MNSRAQHVSVVIPTYRRGAILVDTVKRLLALPEPPSEIVLVDQTEMHPPEVLTALQTLETGGVVRRITLPQPSIPRAMNTGLMAANGAIVLFLDDDIVPDRNLIAAHLNVHAALPDAAAVVGQVLQPEDVGKKAEEKNAETLKCGNAENGKDRNTGKLKSRPTRISECQNFKFSAFYSPLLWRDLDFKFNGINPAWVENVMAGNLSVKRERALAIGGFDENFIPPVSFRFETEFAKRLIRAGCKIRFAPEASIRHLRLSTGGTRSRGSHLTSASPVHGAGDYYYALRCGKGLDRVWYMMRRPFREVCTRFHLTHPWWIPIKFIGELHAVVLAFKRCRQGPRLISEEQA